MHNICIELEGFHVKDVMIIKFARRIKKRSIRHQEKLGQDLVPWILGQEVSQEAFHQVSIHPDWKIIPEANKENGIFEIELLPHRRLNFWFREKCSRGQKKQHP